MWLLKDKPKEEAEEVVKCFDCNTLVAIGDAHKVTVRQFTEYFRYYCGKCKKPYDRVWYSTHPALTTRYFGQVEMTADGTPIGYKKIK